MALWQEREVHSQIRLLYCQTAPWWSTQEGWTWASCYHGLSNFWKKIWSNPLPPKISIFLWSLLQEKLPTNTAINSRLHHISPDCLFCGAKESLRRIFFDCPRAMRIWFGSPLGLRNFTLPNSPIKDCWQLLISPFSSMVHGKLLIQLSAFLLWSTWKCRNLLQFQKQQDCTLVISSALLSLEDFNRAEQVFQVASPPTPVSDQWQPPHPGKLKINFNVAADKRRGKGAVAFVVRNHRWHIIDWRCRMVEHIIDPLILESYASRDAVLYASNNNLGKVTVEGDCQVLLKAIMEGPVPPSDSQLGVWYQGDYEKASLTGFQFHQESRELDCS